MKLLKSVRARSVIALILATICTFLFAKMLYDGKLGEASFIALFIIVCFVCLVIHVFPRIEELDLKRLKVKLDKQIQEIYAKEQDLRKITLLFAEIVSASSILHGRFTDEETYSLRKQWFRSKIKALVESVRITKEEEERILRFDKAFEELDNFKGPTEERVRLAQQASNIFKDEVEKGR